MGDDAIAALFVYALMLFAIALSLYTLWEMF